MKHERAAIMALTFCIGFTTGLIAYGIPVADMPTAVVPATPNTAAVANTQPVANETQAPTQDSVFSYVETDEDGLYHVVEGERIMISPSAAFAPELPEAHQAVYGAVASRDARYVFFCVATSTVLAECAPRVYAADSFTVHPIVVAGESLSLESASVNAAWTSNGELQVNQFVSQTAAEPWLMQ